MSRMLHLTLKKKWFDMIASGEKKEEYREIKEYWVARLVEKDWWFFQSRLPKYTEFLKSPYGNKKLFDAVKREIDSIVFKNGYGISAPLLKTECLGIEIATGNESWGAEPGKEYFVIKLGKII